MSEPLRVIVAGGRKYTDYGQMRRTLIDLYDSTEAMEIVHGGAKGADTLAGQFAAELGRRCKVFPADWSNHGRTAGPIRNIAMAEYADELVAFWDGASRGTHHMIKTALSNRLKTHVIFYDAAPP